MKIIKVCAVVSLLVNTTLAHNMNTGSSDKFGMGDSGSSMFHIPMKVDFDGNITFGYKMNSNHGGMNHGDMGSGMDHSTDMDSGSGMDHGTDMDSGSGMDHGTDMGNTDSGMNDGDSSNNDDHGSMDHNNETQDSNNSGASHDGKSIHWHVMPMLSLGYDKLKRIIALDNNKFKYVEAKKIEVGAGLMVMGHLVKLDWSTMLLAGLMPYKGKYQYVERTIENKNDVKGKNFFKVPSNQEELASWENGDKISFSSHGGVMAHGGVTFGHILDITKDYMFQGKWRVALEKVGPSLVKFTLLNDKMNHSSMTIGNMAMSINTGHMKMEGKSESYLFDLTNVEAQKAYVHALSGDITLAQDESLTNEAVYKESYGTNSMNGSLSVASIQIPVLFVRSSSKMNMYSLGHSTNNDFGMQVETQMSMYSKDKTTAGIFSKHKKRSEMFMAMVMNVTQDRKTHVNYAGTWKRLFERDNVTQNQLAKEISYLQLKTGINDLKINNIPTKENLGYLRTDFEVNLTQGATDKLLLMVKNGERKNLLASTYAVVNKEFRNNAKSLKKICKGIQFKSCHKVMIDKTSTAVVEMWSSLKEMNKAKELGHWKQFSNSYARFGRFLMDNQLSLRSILNKLKKEEYKLKLNVLGENFPEKTFNL